MKPEDYDMAYIGIDLHTDNFTACRLKKNGAMKFSEHGLAKQDMEAFVSTLKSGDEIAVESTSNTAWFREQVERFVSRVVTVDPYTFSRMCQSTSKTDRNDARELAYFLSKGLFRSTRTKPLLNGDILTLASSRELIVKQRVSLTNVIHGMYVRHGIKLPKKRLSSPKFLASLDLDELSKGKQYLVETFRDQSMHLIKLADNMEERIIEMGSGLSGYKGVVSIKGIGGLSASILVAEIGDVRDFSTPGKLASNFGIVPRISQSNKTVVRGRITKSGNGLARKTLIQCTWIAILHSPHLREHYERIKRRSCPNKAIVATARKLLTIIYYTLKNDWEFEDFSSFELKGVNNREKSDD